MAARRPLLLLLLVGSATAAAARPRLAVVSQGPVRVLPLARPAAVFTEMPPALLRVPESLVGAAGCPAVQAGALALYMSTGYVGLCVANASALPVNDDAPPPLGFDLATCSVPLSGESWRSWPPSSVPDHSEWFRNYHGVFAALPLGLDSAAPSMLLVNHGEHKNELCWANDLLYQGLINADVPAASCFSGFQNGSFSDCEAAYNALVTGVVIPFTKGACFGLGAPGNASAVNGGPLVWPVDAYLNSTRGKASYGVRQPGGVVGWKGEAYLFWIDSGFETADVWVARADPAASQGEPGSFRAFDHASAAWSLPTLPAAFDALRFSEFLTAPSPARSGAPMFPLAPTSGAVHFGAARLTVNGDASQQLFVAVYSIVNYSECWPSGAAAPAPPSQGGIGTRIVREILAARHRGPSPNSSNGADDVNTCVPVWRLMLRVTQDFVSFSEAAELTDFAAPGFASALLEYPALLSADGSRQDEVDSSGFYVLATCSSSAAPCHSTYGPQVTSAKVVLDVAAL